MLFGHAFVALCVGLVSGQECPPGWWFVQQDNACFGIGRNPASYAQAVRLCQQSGGDAAKISDAFINAAVSTNALNVIQGQKLYIGVEKQLGGQWVFSDGYNLSYTKWSPGEPSASNQSCAVLDPGTGFWSAADCNGFRPYACLKWLTAAHCLEGWQYASITRSCYYLQDFTTTQSKWSVFSAADAELRCTQLNAAAHLVSVHSSEEEAFLASMLQTFAIKNATLAPDGESACTAAYAWTGLQYHIASGLVWTDGSAVDWQPAIYKIGNDTYYSVCGSHSDKPTLSSSMTIAAAANSGVR